MAPPAGSAADADKEFELQAPPEGKRSRTPNDLDNPPAEEPVEETAVEEEPAKEVDEQTPATPQPSEEDVAAEDAAPEDAAPTTPGATSGRTMTREEYVAGQRLAEAKHI